MMYRRKNGVVKMNPVVLGTQESPPARVQPGNLDSTRAGGDACGPSTDGPLIDKKVARMSYLL